MSLKKVSDAALPAVGMERNIHGDKSPPRPTSYGGVVVDSLGRLLLRSPTNHFDGYVWTFPKGRPEPDESPEQTALREVLEETGVHGEIIAKLHGSFRGGTGWTEYYLMRPLGVPDDFDRKETAEIRWTTTVEAKPLINMTQNQTGRVRDHSVLRAAVGLLNGITALKEVNMAKEKVAEKAASDKKKDQPLFDQQVDEGNVEKLNSEPPTIPFPMPSMDELVAASRRHSLEHPPSSRPLPLTAIQKLKLALPHPTPDFQLIPNFDARHGYKRCKMPGIGISVGSHSGDADFWRNGTGELVIRITSRGYVYSYSVKHASGKNLTDNYIDNTFVRFLGDLLYCWIVAGINYPPSYYLDECSGEGD